MEPTKSSNKKRHYFMAVLPDEPLQNEITKLKKHMAEIYHSQNALKSPPHITLFPPFHYEADKEDQVIRTLNLFCQSKLPFEINLVDFGSFSPRVIYIDVEENRELDHIHHDLLHWIDLYLKVNTGKEGERKFKPHITIASGDLAKRSFYRAWEEFKGRHISYNFLVDSIYLLAHNGKTWDILKRSPFGGSPTLNP